MGAVPRPPWDVLGDKWSRPFERAAAGVPPSSPFSPEDNSRAEEARWHSVLEKVEWVGTPDAAGLEDPEPGARSREAQFEPESLQKAKTQSVPRSERTTYRQRGGILPWRE